MKKSPASEVKEDKLLMMQVKARVKVGTLDHEDLLSRITLSLNLNLKTLHKEDEEEL